MPRKRFSDRAAYNSRGTNVGRIYVGPVEIAGYYRNLYYGLRELGYEVDYITFTPHRFQYIEARGWIERALHSNAHKKKVAHSRGLRILRALERCVLLAIFCVTAIKKYKVFIFGFGRSLLPYNVDLPVLRAMGKKVIVNVGHGSELRPAYMDGSWQAPDGDVIPSAAELHRIVCRQKRRIRWIQMWASHIIGTPYSSTQLASGTIINYFSLGASCVRPKIHQADSQNVGTSSAVRILHAPSHRAFKGTQYIRSAVARLKSKGYSIHYIEVVDRPNSDVMQEIAACDFIVDQIYSDTPMATLSSEAALFGKPAVVAGYRLKELEAFVPGSMFPPANLCMPEEVEKAIEVLICDPNYRKDLGQRAKEFVERQWSCKRVAERYIGLINGDIPDDWRIRTDNVIYPYGAGQSSERTAHNIRCLIEEFGANSLQVNHHPQLKQALCALAYRDRD